MMLTQVIQVTTLASPVGIGGFFPTGFFGIVNGVQHVPGQLQTPAVVDSECRG